MNKDWIDFLATNTDIPPKPSYVDFPTSSESITAISNLTILKVSGKDSSQFIQGQLACNINELTKENSFYTAFCNVKGRTISTLIVLKNNDDDFLLVLPAQLIEKVSKKLQMYILRSDVKLTNMTEELCLIGLNTSNTDIFSHIPDVNFAVSNTDILIIKVPSAYSRYLMIANTSQAIQHWSRITSDCNINPSLPDSWDYQDISAGIPWLTQETTEEFIPQMLNIDKLGGISFNKGCYTGQEIIARTHYLGKAKRALYVAECSLNVKLDSNTRVLTDDKTQSNTQILSFQSDDQRQKILLVMPTSDAELKNLILDNSNQDKITIIDFQ